MFMAKNSLKLKHGLTTGVINTLCNLAGVAETTPRGIHLYDEDRILELLDEYLKMPTSVPKGHAVLTKLAGHVGVSPEKWLSIIKVIDLPEPDGHYRAANGRVYPYYNIDKFVEYTDSLDYELFDEEDEEDDLLSRAPYFSPEMSRQWLQFRRDVEMIFGRFRE
jgi:hypothetical protein